MIQTNRRDLTLPKSGGKTTIRDIGPILRGELQKYDSQEALRVILERCVGSIAFPATQTSRAATFRLTNKPFDECGGNQISVEDLDTEDVVFLQEEILDLSGIENSAAESEAADASTKSEAEARETPAPATVEKGDAD